MINLMINDSNDGVESNLVCNHMSDKKNWMTEAGVNMSVTCMINNRIGQHKFLLAINHNHYNFWKKYI